MNDSKAGEGDQNTENPKFTEFFTTIFTIFLNFELPDRVHLHFKCLDIIYPEASRHLGAILSILTRLKDSKINLVLMYILLNSIRDKKIMKTYGQCLQ